MSACQPAQRRRTCRRRALPGLARVSPPAQRLSADTSKQTAAEETKHLQTPAAGSCFAEEGRSWDPPALSLNTFHDREAIIAAAKSTGPTLREHHGADGPRLEASLPD